MQPETGKGWKKTQHEALYIIYQAMQGKRMKPERVRYAHWYIRDVHTVLKSAHWIDNTQESSGKEPSETEETPCTSQHHERVRDSKGRFLSDEADEAADDLDDPATWHEVTQAEVVASAPQPTRDSFSDFVDYMAQERKLHIGAFHRKMAMKLDTFYTDVMAGKNPRLLICAPPQHGKSEILSRLFPAWVMGKNREMNLIACSYSQALASRMCGDVVRMIETESYQSVWALDWEVKRANHLQAQDASGSYWCAGAGGSLTGMRADIAIIDDPIKDFAHAQSKVQMEKLNQWFQGVLSTRLSPKSGLLIAMTRWHPDDLAGQILTSLHQGNPEHWEVLKFPAMCLTQEEDPLERKVGEPLHPERYGPMWLHNKRHALGTLVWETLYQQNPQSALSYPIKGEWFGTYKVIPELVCLGIFADTALKTGKEHDWSVFQLWGKGKDSKLYLIDQLRGKWEGADLRKMATQFYRLSQQKAYALVGGPAIRAFYMEEAASGTLLAQTLRKEDGIPIKPIHHSKDKIARLWDVHAYIEGGFVVLPEQAPYLPEFLDECVRFNTHMTHRHDDQVDTMCDAIDHFLLRTDLHGRPSAFEMYRACVNIPPDPYHITKRSPLEEYFARANFTRFMAMRGDQPLILKRGA